MLFYFIICLVVEQNKKKTCKSTFVMREYASYNVKINASGSSKNVINSYFLLPTQITRPLKQLNMLWDVSSLRSRLFTFRAVWATDRLARWLPAAVYLFTYESEHIAIILFVCCLVTRSRTELPPPAFEGKPLIWDSTQPYTHSLATVVMCRALLHGRYFWGNRGIRVPVVSYYLHDFECSARFSWFSVCNWRFSLTFDRLAFNAKFKGHAIFCSHPD
jgi:hypothetical protein